MRKITALISTSVALLIIIYGAVTTFSESREYGRVSLAYYLLTPKDLSQLSKYCENKPRFSYSSADGPKPAITHLHCDFEENKINSYINKNNFEQASKNQFKKGSTEIGFEKNDFGKIVLTTVYEYL